MKHSIAIYGSHDASISIRISSDEYKVYELERLTQKRYYSLNKDSEYKSVIDTMYDFLEREHGFTEYDSIFYCECDEPILNYIAKKFAPAHMEKMQHHFGHAACGLWQSNFDEALIISFDGGGWDIDGISFFNIFTGNKKTNTFTKIGSLPLDICSAYTLMAYPLKSVEKKDMGSYLAWAGKIMGLAGHGRVLDSHIEKMRAFYYGQIDMPSLSKLFSSIFSGGKGEMNSVDHFQTCANIAATSQKVFEDIFFSAIEPYIYKYDLPVVITGGGALNVINNQSMYNKLKGMGKQLFIPCNPNDCGLSLGFMLLRYPPDSGKMEQITYSGFPLIDKEELTVMNHLNTKQAWIVTSLDFKGMDKGIECDIKTLAKHLVEGKIIGIIQGGSEVGPRALGNRSILAYPKEGVKDKINSKIKFREWYRPLSPVCRMEDAGEYFHEPVNSEYMTYSQSVKDVKYEMGLSIVHEDGTARLQTVTKEQNPVLHELLCEVNALTGVGILINTSFNSKGKPILTTIKEALQVLKDTELDGVWVNGYLFTK